MNKKWIKAPSLTSVLIEYANLWILKYWTRFRIVLSASTVWLVYIGQLMAWVAAEKFVTIRFQDYLICNCLIVAVINRLPECGAHCKHHTAIGTCHRLSTPEHTWAVQSGGGVQGSSPIAAHYERLPWKPGLRKRLETVLEFGRECVRIC